MRNICIAIIATLIATNTFAADFDGTLAPGKPAGVRQAQYMDNTALYIVGAGILAAGIALAVSSGGNHNNGGSSTITTTTTAP